MKDSTLQDQLGKNSLLLTIEGLAGTQDWQNLNILELGSRQNEGFGWDFRPLFANSNYIGIDVKAGPGVDVVLDAHEIEGFFAFGHFDLVIACATFEHLRKPWEVVNQIHKLLKPEGLLFIETHFCFIEHDFPHDYYRWTRAGLMLLMSEFSEVISAYRHETTLGGHPEPVYKNVLALGRK